MLFSRISGEFNMTKKQINERRRKKNERTYNTLMKMKKMMKNDKEEQAEIAT